MTSNVPPLLLTIILNFYYYVFQKIFDRVYSTSQMIIDEEYHLPLGLAYCKFDFAAWDPKVTTLPGLYLVSAVLLGPFDLCTTYWLRYISFIAAIFNIPLFFALLSVYHKQNNYLNVLSSFTLALCPPLFFFGHLYYTETVSLMMILLMFLASERDCHYLASIIGFLAIMVRQTNAIWVGFVLGRYILLELYATVMNNMRKCSVRKVFPTWVS
nr:putative Dol-P-Glc:Glc(2)Man(9)GlcNAc(2)-PP-Dol alpha-1,2-glucosyltransferase [Leptinotarsa decemlineata]